MMKVRKIFLWALVCGVFFAPQNGNATMIEGRVSFEKRTTVVPLWICPAEASCAHPQTYWSMVLKSQDQGEFEYTQPMALGSDRAPDSVSVAGVEIRPGAQVELDATVDAVNDRFGIITQVASVTVLSDPRTEGDSEPGILSGWSCRQVTPTTPGLYVTVSGDHHRPRELYHMRILLAKTAGASSVAEINSLTLDAQGDHVIYRGSNPTTAAELTIRNSTDPDGRFPAELRVYRIYSTPNFRVPLESTLELRCFEIS